MLLHGVVVGAGPPGSAFFQHNETGGSARTAFEPAPADSFSPLAAGEFGDRFLLLFGLNGTGPQPPHAGDGVVRRQSFRDEVTSDHHAGPAQTGAAMDGDTHAVVGRFDDCRQGESSSSGVGGSMSTIGT